MSLTFWDRLAIFFGLSTKRTRAFLTPVPDILYKGIVKGFDKFDKRWFEGTFNCRREMEECIAEAQGLSRVCEVHVLLPGGDS